ncbi:MAG: MFS transporter [Legionellaceae bacterium]|nr:MFS transporter [Legionellaceae bacterium]
MSVSAVVDAGALKPQSSAKAWLVCLSAGLFFLYEFFQLNLFDTINNELQLAFQIDAIKLGWMSSSYLLADILFLLPAGLLLDRFSPRLIILIALSICISGTVGFALTSSYPLAFFFHFLSGIGNAFCLLSCVMLVSRWFPPKRQAFIIGLVVTMAFIGGMLAHAPFAKLNEWYGWRQALLLDGALGVLILLWIYKVVEDYPSTYTQPRPVKGSPWQSGLLNALKNKQNWLAGLYTSFLNLPIMVFGALWGSNYLMTVFGLDKMSASAVTANILLGSIFGCPLAGWLSDRSGKRKPLMILGAVTSLLLMLPLYQGMPLSIGQLHVLFFLLGLTTSTQVISYPLIAESNPPQYTGAATSIASILIMGGGGVAQMIFSMVLQLSARQNTNAGWLENGVHHYHISDYQHAALMFPIAFGLALIAVLLLRETYCQRRS